MTGAEKGHHIDLQTLPILMMESLYGYTTYMCTTQHIQQSHAR